MKLSAALLAAIIAMALACSVRDPGHTPVQEPTMDSGHTPAEAALEVARLSANFEESTFYLKAAAASIHEKDSAERVHFSNLITRLQDEMDSKEAWIQSARRFINDHGIAKVRRTGIESTDGRWQGAILGTFEMDRYLFGDGWSFAAPRLNGKIFCVAIESVAEDSDEAYAGILNVELLAGDGEALDSKIEGVGSDRVNLVHLGGILPTATDFDAITLRLSTHDESQ